MSNVRGRRGSGQPVDGRRHTGRIARVAHTRPVPGVRAAAPSRPGRRRPGRRPARSAGTRTRRPLFTGRAVLLAGLILLLALTLAGPMRGYLAGRAEITRLAAEGRALDQRAQALTVQLHQESSPAFQERQARARLTYVLPGDRLVMVVDGKAVPGDAAASSAAAATRAKPPWYQGLLESVSVADG
jgi:cell division protein FtsB